MTILVIAEKPSMARNIRDGLSSADRARLKVINAQGHLMGLAEPDHYLPDSVPKNSKGRKIWRPEDLPIIPAKWKRTPSGDARQRALFKSVISDIKGASEIIHAGDPDREGQLLIDELIEEAGFRGPVQRVWLPSLSPEVVQAQFKKLKPNSEYADMSAAADARSKADWLVGMNMTREWTILNHKLVSLGRVQWPTLMLVVERDLEIENFVPTDYFNLTAFLDHASGGVKASFMTPEDAGAPAYDSEGRLLDAKTAREIIERAKGDTAVCVSFSEKKESSEAPMPFDMTKLAKVGSSLLHLTAKEVLDVAQTLYDSKYTTYPRTECQYLPEDEMANAPRIIGGMDLPADVMAKLDFSRKHKAWNSKKVEVHNGIIPTTLRPKPGELNRQQQVLYDLICRSYVALFAPKAEARNRSAIFELAGHRWEARGKTYIEKGWRDITGAASKDSELAVFKEGDRLPCSDAQAEASQTRPPARFTDGTLMEAMAAVHKFVSDPEIKAALHEASGIGTVATRPATIQTLVDRTYVDRVGKKKEIISTKLARELYEHRERIGLSLVTTASWEDQLKAIGNGEMEAEAFLVEIERWVSERMGKAVALNNAGGPAKPAQPGPECPACKVKTIQLKTKAKGKLFYKCESCQACWWPGFKNEKKLGKQWPPRN